MCVYVCAWGNREEENKNVYVRERDEENKLPPFSIVVTRVLKHVVVNAHSTETNCTKRYLLFHKAATMAAVFI